MGKERACSCVNERKGRRTEPLSFDIMTHSFIHSFKADPWVPGIGLKDNFFFFQLNGSTTAGDVDPSEDSTGKGKIVCMCVRVRHVDIPDLHL